VAKFITLFNKIFLLNFLGGQLEKNNLIRLSIQTE